MITSQHGLQQHIQLLQGQPQPEILLHHELGHVLQGPGDLFVLRLQLLLVLHVLCSPGVTHLLPRGAVQLADLVEIDPSVKIQCLNSYQYHVCGHWSTKITLHHATS